MRTFLLSPYHKKKKKKKKISIRQIRDIRRNYKWWVNGTTTTTVNTVNRFNVNYRCCCRWIVICYKTTKIKNQNTKLKRKMISQWYHQQWIGTENNLKKKTRLQISTESKKKKILHHTCPTIKPNFCRQKNSNRPVRPRQLNTPVAHTFTYRLTRKIAAK